MTLRKSILLAAIPIVLLGSVAVAWSWLLHSEPGARWLFSKLQNSAAFTLDVASISGDLGSGVQVSELQFDNESVRLEIRALTVALNLDLLPPAANLELLRARSTVVQTLQNNDGTTASDDPFDLAQILQQLSLPVPVHVKDLKLDKLEFIDEAGESLVQVHSAALRGKLHEALTLETLTIAMDGNELALSGHLGLKGPHPVDMQIATTGEVAVTARFEGTLKQMQLAISSDMPQAKVTGTLHNVLSTPEWNINLQSQDLRWPLNAADPQARLTDLAAHSTGQWSEYKLKLDGTLHVPELEPTRLELEGSGGKDAFVADRLRLDGPELALDSQATVSWAEDLSIELSASLDRLHPENWIQDWPENHKVSGDLALSWSGDRIAVPRFDLAVGETPFRADGDGVLDLSTGRVDGRLNWRELNWPLGATQPQFSSLEGRFEVSGSLEDWKIDGALDIKAAEYPEGQLRLTGTGDQKSVEIQLHEGAVLGGIISGTIDFNWTENQAFRASLLASEVQTAALFEQAPGYINAELSTAGQLQPLAIEMDIQRFDGIIRQLPVNGTGGLRYAEGVLNVNGLELNSGPSSLLLDGNPYEPAGIEFAADIKSLSQFSEKLGGTLNTRGRLSLQPESPSFSATLSAQQLTLGSVTMQAVETKENRLEFSGLMLGETEVESLSLEFNSGEPLEEIIASATLNGDSIDLQFNGSVIDWADPLGSGWSGALSGLRINRGDRFTLTLDEPAEMVLASDRFLLEDACFLGSNEGRMCANTSWDSLNGIDVSVDLSGIAVSLLGVFIETDVRFNQRLSGSINWRQTAEAKRTGAVKVEMSPGTITVEGDEELYLETGLARFGFVVDDSQLREGNLDISLPPSGLITAEFSVDNLRQGLDSPVTGSARMDLNDIGSVGRLFPVLDTMDGVLDVDLNLAGTLADPAFKGRVILSDGAISNRASGFSFSEINLAGEISEGDRSVIKGSFRAGEGTGEINTRIDFENILSPIIDFSLTGQDLTLIDVPDLKMIANPDLQLSWKEKTLQINGRVKIPSVRLSPSFIPKASVRQSSDVVIVEGELAAQEPDILKKKAIKLRGELEVELGDDIVVDLDVAQIDVTGAARFSWRDELIPVANGSFNATGDIRAYGQFLRVTQGRLSFPNSPADNPHLNIRAEREIFGNSQIRRAGLMVAGTLKRPVVEAYTVPMTNKERAQTLLVTGSDFNYEQGVGAVDVGMYVLPRLYVSYGIGVFEDGNVLKVRYDLGRGFGIRATSGQRETGLDVSYTIDK